MTPPRDIDDTGCCIYCGFPEKECDCVEESPFEPDQYFCAECGGTGVIWDSEECDACNGTGIDPVNW